MPQNIRLKSLVLFSVILVLFIFLFVDGEVQHKHRLIKDIWDAGHLVFFSLISFGYFDFTKKHPSSAVFQIILTTIFCLFAGSLIESLQLLVDRDFSFNDILNNLIGGYLGLLFFNLRQPQQAFRKRLTHTILFLILLVVGSRNFTIDLIDEFFLQNDFPVLASFETSFEKTRWDYQLSHSTFSKKHSKQGQHSMQVEFLPGQYPGIHLEHFINDWSAYHSLSFSLYNPNKDTFAFVVKVYDQKHIENGYPYIDRFNKVIKFKPGWNHITISLNEIRMAPNQRKMDMKKIKDFSFFTTNLQHPVTMYFDHLFLH